MSILITIMVNASRTCRSCLFRFAHCVLISYYIICHYYLCQFVRFIRQANLRMLRNVNKLQNVEACLHFIASKRQIMFTNQSVNQNQAINQASNQSRNQSNRQSINQSVNQLIMKSSSQSIHQVINQSINQSLILFQTFPTCGSLWQGRHNKLGRKP